MLAFLRGHASDRKLRLFAVICCSPFLPLVGDPICCSVWEVADRIANDEATEPELEDAAGKLFGQYVGPWYDSGPRTWETIDAIRFKSDAAAAILCASGGSMHNQAAVWENYLDSTSEMLRWLKEAARGDDARNFIWMEQTAADLLRDIFGPLAFHPVTVSPLGAH
jgi:hypothetical protein